MSDKAVVLYGADWCSYCVSLKANLDDRGVEYIYKDVDQPAIRKQLTELSDGNQTIPVLFIGDSYWVNPGNDILNEKLDTKTKRGDMMQKYDVVMIGGGPANLAAAVYTSREDIKTLIIEKGLVGGLAAITDMIDNYPGFEEGIEGMKLAEKLGKQAERFGTTIELDEVQSITKQGDIFEIKTAIGGFEAKSILVGTGSEWKKLGIPGEKEFHGRGIHNCATCDGAFYREKKLVVVGGGNSSAQEALFLTKFASHIDVLIRGEAWKASEVLIKEIDKNEKITVHFNTTTDEVVGGEVDGMLRVNKVIGTKDGKVTDFITDGVFVFIGLKPVTYFLEGSGVDIDEYGFVKTDNKHATNVEGIFCAGDVRSGATMQIASAVGEGAAAALSIREYLAEHSRKK